jgi:hypothetical protein
MPNNICTSIRKRLYNFILQNNTTLSLGLIASHIYENVPPSWPVDKGATIEIQEEARGDQFDMTAHLHSETRTFTVKLALFWGNVLPSTREGNIENKLQLISEAIDQSLYLLDGIDGSSLTDSGDNGEEFDWIRNGGWQKLYDGPFAIGAMLTMTWNIVQTWQKDTRITLTNGSLVAPTLDSPADDGSSGTSTIFFSWLAVTGATSYQLQVSWDGLFGDDTFYADQSGITDITYEVRNLDAGIPIYWRVRAANGDGNSAWSATRIVTVTMPEANP